VADETTLRQALENLYRNAAEHGTDGVDAGSDGSITVAVGATPDGFYVADDGAGIPADERDQVFEHGYTTRSEGTGFGLSIVREIVEAHDWSITVTESEDGGARFEISGVESESTG
jgi:signal transduction histidine kinase